MKFSLAFPVALCAATFSLSCASSQSVSAPAALLPVSGSSASGIAAERADQDEFAAAVTAIPNRAVGLFHRYEFCEVRDTPPPSGYEPFYISHYGRHGSRYQIDKRSFAVVETLEKGAKAGVLTPQGQSALQRLRPILEEHDGMWGMLSRLGAEEHKDLARRMFRRFPEVFRGGGRIRAQSSTIQRCLASMANFACELKGLEPKLDFSFSTGERFMQVILHPYLKSEERKQWLAQFDEKIVRDNVDADRLWSLCFKDTPEAREIAPDPCRFAFDLFVAAASFESLTEELGGADVRDLFTLSEWIALGRARSCIHYAHMGNCAEFGWCATASASNLALDIAQRAAEAVADGGIRADLRFGHDSGLRPLAGFIGIEGAGACSPAAESWKTSPTWRDMPMASNLQLVFYRKSGEPVLVKVLYNEEEKRIEGLGEPLNGAYYLWSDLQKLLTRSVETPQTGN